MRQLLTQVPRGQGARVADHARNLDAINVTRWEGTGDGAPHDVVMLHLPNGRVQDFLDWVADVEDSHTSFSPQGVFTLKPPPEEAPQQVKDVQLRSPIEVFLGGMQSVGSWKGFIGYAVAAGVVVWTGLFTGTVYLLTAAMLIAPFAGPAMNTAIATALGNGRLLRQSLIRYSAALAVTVGVTALLSLVLGQEVATFQMVERSQVSEVAVLLPLAAGFAGAMFLIQSERDSLVSGAAVGVLVAASLAPPAGVVGMAAAIGRWDFVTDTLFVLALQLVGINFSGALTFRAAGLSRKGVRYNVGSGKVFPISLAVTALALAGLLYLQFSDPLRLERSSLAQHAAALVQEVVNESGEAALIEASARFTRSNAEGQEALLSQVYVQPRLGTALSDEELRRRLTRLIQRRLNAEYPFLTPLVSVSVLDPPG